MTIAPSPSRASDPLGAGPLDAGESLGAPGTLGSNSASAQDSAAGMTRRRFFEVLLASSSLLAVGSMAGCVAESSRKSSATISTSNATVSISTSAWNYDSDNDIYYQLGVHYCTNPQAPAYESMGIYVPGAYFDATQNADGTYTCAPKDKNSVGGFTASTAPIVMPIDSAGYSAQAAPTEYDVSRIADYTDAGFVYVYAGCRGRQQTDDATGSAPWGVTDLKAAVRTLRANASNLAGDASRIFSFGHSGGGALSAILAASGDAEGYDDYLAMIGAPSEDLEGNPVSDAIYGAMCWCPITCLDQADAAYEWNMGQFSSSGSRTEGSFAKQLSNDLAASYASYINGLGLTANGTALKLAEGGEGIYTSGTYYDQVKSVIEQSLNNFLSDTAFPYTPSNETMADMGAGGGQGEGPSSGASGDGPSDGGAESTAYETASDYIAELNAKGQWIIYDEATNTATITGLSGFVNACKAPTKSVGAFDALDRSQAENAVFGDDGNGGLHFDATMAQLLEDNASTYASLPGWESSYPSDYREDLAYQNNLGKTVRQRTDIYNPLYYLAGSYGGAGTSTPAAHWRIRTGIEQGDTACTTEINLALAALSAKGVKDVDFATVWGKGHTAAERTGDSTQNFIAWVQECCS